MNGGSTTHSKTGGSRTQTHVQSEHPENIGEYACLAEPAVSYIGD